MESSMQLRIFDLIFIYGKTHDVMLKISPELKNFRRVFFRTNLCLLLAIAFKAFNNSMFLFPLISNEHTWKLVPNPLRLWLGNTP